MSRLSRNISVVNYSTAAILVERAILHAQTRNWAIAVVVSDPSGHVVASGRMDGVPAQVHDFACDKALTATLGNSTRAFCDRMSSARELELGLVNRPRLCAWQGGVPIVEGGMLIGGLGVSGAAGPEDEACAKAALEAMVQA